MESNRRHFVKQIFKGAGALALAGSLPSFIFSEEDENKFDFKISLAQWSLHKSLFEKKINALDFPVVARTKFQIEAVEYVNQFFKDKAKDNEFLKQLKQRCDDNGVKSLLIMVDQEGHLGESGAEGGQKAVENHYKWVDAAAFLKCHSIRVNLHGNVSQEEWQKASVENLGKLAEYGAKNKINVIVENHGSYSSNGQLLAGIIKQINNPYCGTLPDFGNFCMKRERAGDLWETPCVEWYDRYKGVKEMLPYAKGVSAKSFDFDAQGNETTIDFLQMMKMVKESKYKGYVGIEYEGNGMSEDEGILATKKLLEKVRKQLS
jgi:sugar phosphate isomerase/epimerase